MFQALHRCFDSADTIVFFDFEATQFSHKAIALGVVIQPKKVGFLTDFIGEPIVYKAYIKTKEPIGSVVENLTGINEEILNKAGKDFHSVILEVSNLLRPYHIKKFISYGNFDVKILSHSISSQDFTEINFLRHVQKNYFDLASYIGKRIVSESGNLISLTDLAGLYFLKTEDIQAHDPLFDSLLLKEIYQHYVQDENKTLELALKNYSKNRHVNEINRHLISTVIQGKTLNCKDVLETLKEYL